MEVTFAPRGIVQIDNARIIFRNFAGLPSKFNREGDRSFAIIIPDEELANRLIEDGWNVKVKAPREEGDIPFMYLTVKVKFNDYGPNVYLKSGKAVNRLNEETIAILDGIDILEINLDIRPYDWETNGKSGRTAYLRGMDVIQNVDRFDEKYAEEEFPEE